MILELYQDMYLYTDIFVIAELTYALRMILLMYYFCENHELRKISTVLPTCHN